jgi:hypothetical protein
MAEWIKKIWCLYKMQYNSALKKNEIWSLMMIRIELGNTMLSVISQARGTNTLCSLLCVESKKCWSHRTIEENGDNQRLGLGAKDRERENAAQRKQKSVRLEE